MGHLRYSDGYNALKILGSCAVMNIFNTVADPQAAPNSPEKQAFLQAMLNDYITFDDAEYPEDYDNTFKEGDDDCNTRSSSGVELWCCPYLGV